MGVPVVLENEGYGTLSSAFVDGTKGLASA